MDLFTVYVSLPVSVNMCLDAIKYIVPTDIALQVLSKWYTTHNAPGGPSSQSEWIKFSESLLGLMGYDTSKLAIIQQVGKLYMLCFASNSGDSQQRHCPWLPQTGDVFPIHHMKKLT